MLYSSRKSAVIRYILTSAICAASAIISDDKSFRLFMFVLSGGILVLLCIFYLFWMGFDNGSFTAFYSQDNLEKRDKFIRYFGIFTNYGAIITVVLFLREDLMGIILSAVFFDITYCGKYFLFSNQ